MAEALFENLADIQPVNIFLGFMELRSSFSCPLELYSELPESVPYLHKRVSIISILILSSHLWLCLLTDLFP